MGGDAISPVLPLKERQDLLLDLDHAASGEQAWRFYVVPGDPSKPFENEELDEAAKTWTGEWWKVGGGGTVSLKLDAQGKVDGGYY